MILTVVIGVLAGAGVVLFLRVYDPWWRATPRLYAEDSRIAEGAVLETETQASDAIKPAADQRHSQRSNIHGESESGNLR